MKVIIGLALSLLALNANAGFITVEWNLVIESRYDYSSTSNDESFASITGQGSTTFENVVTRIDDYGTATETTFGDVQGSVINSPITELIEQNPFGDKGSPTAYTFGYTGSYPTEFYEEIATIHVADVNDPGSTLAWVHHIETRASKRTTPRGSNDDYAFDETSILDFYSDFILSGEHVDFNENWAIYDETGGSSFEGSSWSGYVVYTNIYETSAVPIPPTAWLFCSGLLGLISVARRQKA